MHLRSFVFVSSSLFSLNMLTPHGGAYLLLSVGFDGQTGN